MYGMSRFLINCALRQKSKHTHTNRKQNYDRVCEACNNNPPVKNNTNTRATCAETLIYGSTLTQHICLQSIMTP